MKKVILLAALFYGYKKVKDRANERQSSVKKGKLYQTFKIGVFDKEIYEKFLLEK